MVVVVAQQLLSTAVLCQCNVTISLAMPASAWPVLRACVDVWGASAVPRHCTPREMLWLHAKFLFGHWMNDATLALSVQRALVSMDLEAEADQPIEVMEKIYGPSFLRWVLIARAVLRGFDILMVRGCCTASELGSVCTFLVDVFLFFFVSWFDCNAWTLPSHVTLVANCALEHVLPRPCSWRNRWKGWTRWRQWTS